MDPRTDAIGARAAIARAWLGTEVPTTPIALGSVSLHEHQATGVARARSALNEYGGALLADETGLGKTYIAVALIAEAKNPLVIAPSALLPMWRDALATAGATARLHATEALSRGRVPARGDLVVVDEAHHFRNPKARRYAALTDVVTHSDVLLLSATPVHNQRADITALLALFRFNPPLGRVIIRREHTTTTRPRIRPMEWIQTADDEATLQDILELPPPVPPSDGESGGALVVHGLVRQWASSAGALIAALRRRLGRAIAMAAALDRNRLPTYRDLRDWCLGEGAVQLAFPELLIPETTSDSKGLRDAVKVHAKGLRRLIAEMAARPDPDIARAKALNEIVGDRKTVAFSAYEDTVLALARHLRDRRTCALSARGGIVAGGKLSRAEAIARFAPIANGSPPPAPACTIDLLLATDLLSEGLNLQDASAVVHLDLPWTPARMEQRVGRAARIGSQHEEVHVYALSPPASSETMSGVERRLKEKLRQAAQAVGVSFMLFPEPMGTGMRMTLEQWAATDVPSTPFGAVRAANQGFLAAVRVGDEVLLVADLGQGVTDDPDVLALAVAAGEGEPVAGDTAERENVERAIFAWAEAREARDVRIPRVARRIAGIVSRSRAHRRPAVAALAARARRAAVLPLGAGAARLLSRLADSEMDDEVWLNEMATFAETFERSTGRKPPGIAILGMLLFHR